MLPLQGLLVIALEQAVAAAACTVRLADAGARVIKIEREGGETARHYDQVVHGTSAYFAWLNRGKESIVLDVKAPEDRQLLEHMLARADVFVSNLAPGATARLQLDAATLVKKYPQLISLEICGYGQDTDYRNMRAYDLLIQAESGVCAVTGTAEEAVKVGVSIADVTAGAAAHTAILEALLERQQTGRGKAVEIAMFDVMADLMSVPLLYHQYGHQPTPRSGLSHAMIYPYGRVCCQDGEIVLVVQTQAEWRRLCAGVLQQPGLADDPRYNTNPERVKNREALGRVIDRCCQAVTCETLIQQLEENKLAWARVSTVADLAAHPALRRMQIETPGGTAQLVSSPIRQQIKDNTVPELGAQSNAIRAEFSQQRFVEKPCPTRS